MDIVIVGQQQMLFIYVLADKPIYMRFQL